MTEDKRRSMRTSAIIHAIILLLAILPFLKPPVEPKPFQEAVLVEFDKGGSSEGAKQAAPQQEEEAAASEASEHEEVVEEEEVRDVPEVKPVETTPAPSVLTSKVEPPVIKQSKVRKVDVKAPPKPTSTIPQQTKVEEVPTPKKKVVLKPSRAKKVVVRVERPSPKKGKGTGTSTKKTNSTGNGKADGKENDGGKGDGGNGSSKSGDGNDGKGDGKTGDGDGNKGKGKGKGEGDDIGDGVLTRTLIKYPDFAEIIKESGTISVNVCADRTGKVTFVEFNRKFSTISDMDVIRKAVSYAKDYLFEADATAPPRECGRVTFNIKIEE